MTDTFEMKAIGFVKGSRTEAIDDNWGGTTALIELAPGVDPEALLGLDAFSHAEILFVFHGVAPEKVTHGARHPRERQDWPRVGIFAQRAKARPNRIGSTVVRIVGLEAGGLRVAELDAIEGSPVLDIKPVLREFLPRGEVRQPAWVTELMQAYWLTP